MESLKHWYRGGDPNKKIPTVIVGGFGAFAGACSVYGNTPIDVVKTRLQVRHILLAVQHSSRYGTFFLCLFCGPKWLSWMHIRLVIRRLWVQPAQGRQHSFMEVDHEIFSTVILSLLPIQEGQLSVSGERMSTILVNPLED